MKLFIPEPTIGELEGFTSENDIFGRKPIGDGLSHLVANVTDPLVIAVDGQWGTGKTTFLKQWAGELRKAGYPVVFFDAFAHDYTDDAFAAMAGQIIGLVQDLEKKDASAGDQFKRQAIQVGKVLLRSSLHLSAKVATANLLGGKEFEELKKIAVEEIGGLEEKYVGELLTRQRENAATLDHFRSALSQLPAMLASGRLGGNGRPLIFIIDELDRCRPHFALEVLERIKHLFSVPNVHFVLGTHLQQLQSSVSAAYGGGIDPAKYLQKFIQLTIPLTDNSQSQSRDSTRYLTHLANTLGLMTESRASIDFLLHVAGARELSLRDVERLVTQLGLAVAFMTKDRCAPPPLVAGLCALKVLAPELYERARSGNLSWEDARKAFGLGTRLGNGAGPYGPIWGFVTDGRLPEDKRAELSRNLLEPFNFRSSADLLVWVVKDVVERLQPVQ